MLSAFDPDVESEGSIDPLSLSPIYDRLADRILPAFTVRMRKIRFVTAMCVAARVCADDYDDDALAADGVTPPWLVFEWFVVEALIRRADELDDATGVPGGAKVRTAIRQHKSISHKSYLKTAKVFGFSGIFRRFVTQVGVLTNDLALDDGGYAVLRAWEHDVGLDGFHEGADTSVGGEFRRSLKNAVRAGMDAGATVRRATDFWVEVARVFEPSAMRSAERKALHAQIIAPAKGGAGHARELVEALGKHGDVVVREHEPKLLRKIARSASPDLASCLRAIDAYEALCRPILDSFDLVRALSTRRDRRPIDATAFAADEMARELVAKIQKGTQRVDDDPHLGNWEPDAAALSRTFSNVRTAPELFEVVMQHHEQSQHAKPPDGKRPWFERTTGQRAAIRAAYAFDGTPPLDASYVHQYRIPTLSRFLAELKAFS